MTTLLTRARRRAVGVSPLRGVGGTVGMQDGIHLDFAAYGGAGFHYVKVPGGAATVAPLTTLFTFTGGNQSMYRGASGLLVASATNTPRIEYDASGNLLGLLIEGARTNSILQSADFSTSWTSSGNLAFGSGSVLNSNATLDPAGTNTADLVTPNTGTSSHTMSQSYTSTATSWTISIFVKPNGYTKFGIVEVNATASYVTWVLTGSGSVATTNAASGTITAYANGWYRLTMTYTGTAASHNVRCCIMDSGYASGNPASYTYAGDGTSGAYLWGAQVEAGAFPSSYIPTTTGSVARTADVCTRTYGTEFSLLAGTMFAEFRPQSPPDSGTSYFIAAVSGTTGRLGYVNGSAVAVRDSATTETFNATSLTAGVMYKYASAYTSASVLAGTVNGGTVESSATAGNMGAGTVLSIGCNDSGGSNLFGHIRRLDYWPERKANLFLQQVTA